MAGDRNGQRREVCEGHKSLLELLCTNYGQAKAKRLARCGPRPWQDNFAAGEQIAGRQQCSAFSGLLHAFEGPQKRSLCATG